MKSLNVSTHQRTEFVDITSEVEKAVTALGVKDGVITVFVPHTTSGVTINASWLRVIETALSFDRQGWQWVSKKGC